jgi:hypothetical protein
MALYYPLFMKHKCLHNEKSNITTDNAPPTAGFIFDPALLGALDKDDFT